MASNIRYTFPRQLLLGIVLVNGFVDAAHHLDAGPISAMGVLTIVTCLTTWILWAERPVLSQVFGAMLPSFLYCVYAFGSAPLNPPTTSGLQTMLVILSFFGCILLAAREVSADPSLADRIGKMTEWAFWICFAICATQIVGIVPASWELIGDRSAALYVLIPLGYYLGKWRAGDRRAPIICLLILGLLFHGLSRMGLVAGTLMVPIAVMVRGDRKALIQTLLATVFCGLALCALIMFYQPMYDRFFTEDTSMEVGGMKINASGRTLVWGRIWESFEKHPVFGQGAGSTGEYTLVDGMDHPHNDYLRIAHDYGIVGVSLFIAGLLSILVQLYQNAQRGKRDAQFIHPMYVGAFVSLVGISMTMVTDNPLSYIYVMAPLGVVVGSSLGLGYAGRSFAHTHESEPFISLSDAMEHSAR